MGLFNPGVLLDGLDDVFGDMATYQAPGAGAVETDPFPVLAGTGDRDSPGLGVPLAFAAGDFMVQARYLAAPVRKGLLRVAGGGTWEITADPTRPDPRRARWLLRCKPAVT